MFTAWLQWWDAHAWVALLLLVLSVGWVAWVWHRE